MMFNRLLATIPHNFLIHTLQCIKPPSPIPTLTEIREQSMMLEEIPFPGILEKLSLDVYGPVVAVFYLVLLGVAVPDTEKPTVIDKIKRTILSNPEGTRQIVANILCRVFRYQQKKESVTLVAILKMPFYAMGMPRYILFFLAHHDEAWCDEFVRQIGIDKKKSRRARKFLLGDPTLVCHSVDTTTRPYIPLLADPIRVYEILRLTLSPRERKRAPMNISHSDAIQLCLKFL